MIRQILPIVVAACIAPCFAAEGWLTDMDAAKKEAAEQKKDLMIEFTGSDWCPPCMQLRANVFSKPDFQKEAQKNFVLLELDYPRSKEQSAEVKAANQKLAEQYGVTGFPTVVFADASGKPFGGFVGGRPREDVMKAMQDALKNKEALQVVKSYPNRDKLLPETQQELLMMEFGTFLNSTGDVDGAVLILDKVAELKPGTEAGQQAPRIKAGILANKDRIKAQIEAAKKAQNK